MLLLLAQQACTAGRDLRPLERLDPQSAVTTTIMAEPWVYARDVPAIAANSRDYLNVGVVETNRAGLRGYWLGVVAWSTVDRSALRSAAQPLSPAALTLIWTDDSLELMPAAAGRAAIGANRPIFPGPQPGFEEAWYLLSLADLARFEQGPPQSVSLAQADDRVVVYGTWKVEPVSLRRFLEATGHPGRPQN